MSVWGNFRRYEFVCPCGCGFSTVDLELHAALQALRTEIGSPIVISRGGGCRCESYNDGIGGAKNSWHTKGMAADISSPGASPMRIYAALDRLFHGRYGLIIYPRHVHIDVRPGAYRGEGSY